MKSIYRTFLKCDQCNNTLKDKESLEKHKDNVHSLRICHICSYTTKAGSNALRYHVQTKHQVQFDENKPITELKCTAEGCEKVFYRQGDLNLHHKQLHTRRECPICHKLFRKQHLQNHIYRIHQNKSKYCCEKCGKGYIYIKICLTSTTQWSTKVSGSNAGILIVNSRISNTETNQTGHPMNVTSTGPNTLNFCPKET